MRDPLKAKDPWKGRWHKEIFERPTIPGGYEKRIRFLRRTMGLFAGKPSMIAMSPVDHRELEWGLRVFPLKMKPKARRGRRWL